MLPLVKAYYPARATVTPIKFGEIEKDGELRVQIAVEFQVEATDDRPELQEFTGETITWIGHFTDKTSERTLEALQIAGWQGEDVSELAGIAGSEALRDQVSLACDVDEYDGKQQLKVNWVNKPRGHFAFKQEASADSLRALGARLRSTAKAVRAGGGAPRKAASGSGGARGGGRSSGGGGAHPNAPGSGYGGHAGGPDDDIPFASADIGHEPSPIAPVLRRPV